jgi:hypothetical protein
MANPCTRLNSGVGAMNINRYAIFIFVCFALADSCVAKTRDVGENADCAFSTVKLEVNMPRLEAERRISAAIGEPNEYSPYAINLSGGTTTYESRNCTLTVTYAAGAPAPTVSTQDGGTVHMLPKDETVLNFELTRKNSSSLRLPFKPRV